MWKKSELCCHFVVLSAVQHGGKTCRPAAQSDSAWSSRPWTLHRNVRWWIHHSQAAPGLCKCQRNIARQFRQASTHQNTVKCNEPKDRVQLLEMSSGSTLCVWCHQGFRVLLEFLRSCFYEFWNCFGLTLEVHLVAKQSSSWRMIVIRSLVRNKQCSLQCLLVCFTFSSFLST